MSNAQIIQRKIKSAESLKSIVSTMKAYASANISQFQTAAKASMEYDEIIRMSLYVTLSTYEERERIRLCDKNKGKLFIVFGSDHGLAGRFNENISLFAEEIIKKERHEKNRIIICGQQIEARLAHLPEKKDVFYAPQSLEAIIESVIQILFKLDQYNKDIHEVFLIYNKSEGQNFFKENYQQLYPVSFKKIARDMGAWESNSLPQVLIDREKMLSELVKQYLFISIYRTFCYSLASENASRLASMQTAESNIEERLALLQAEYQRKRQNDITEEINDVISGFKAIKKRV